MDTWSSWPADVGNESIEEGWQRTLFSETKIQNQAFEKNSKCQLQKIAMMEQKQGKNWKYHNCRRQDLGKLMKSIGFIYQVCNVQQRITRKQKQKQKQNQKKKRGWCTLRFPYHIKILNETNHCWSQHRWESLRSFVHHYQHGRNKSRHCWVKNVGSYCVRLQVVQEYWKKLGPWSKRKEHSLKSVPQSPQRKEFACLMLWK